MNVLIELPNLLSKLRIISYSDYRVETQDEKSFIVLHTRQGSIRYEIIDTVSHHKQAEITHFLNQYKS